MQHETTPRLHIRIEIYRGDEGRGVVHWGESKVASE